MWAYFDDTNFPRVSVILNGVPKSNKDFDDFLTTWNSFNYNRNNEKYIFVFNTINVGFVNIKYAYKMTEFIKSLKQTQTQNLIGSIILVKNTYIRFLLKLIFLMQKPVAEVYLLNQRDLALAGNSFITDLENNLLFKQNREFSNVTVVRC